MDNMHEGRSNLCKEGRSSHTNSMCIYIYIYIYISLLERSVCKCSEEAAVRATFNAILFSRSSWVTKVCTVFIVSFLKQAC